MDTARVVVTGGRAFPDAGLVFELLTHVAGRALPLLVAEGGCPRGVDAHVRAWRDKALALGLPVVGQTYRADWSTYGLAAGPRRNREMLDTVKPHVVFAFPGHRGTYDCIVAATDRKIPVLRIPELTFVESKELVLCPRI